MIRWGSFIVRRRWAVLAVSLLFVIIAGVLGAKVSDKLITGGYIDQSSASAEADRELADRFAGGTPNLILLADSSGSVDSETARQAGTALTEKLRAEPNVTEVQSYWAAQGNPELQAGLKSRNGQEALILARVGGTESEAKKQVKAMADRYAGTTGPLTVKLGGQTAVDNAVDAQSASDLLRAELIVMPITLIILLLVFGSGVAAGLPLVIAGVSVVGTQFILDRLTGVTDVSIFALNLTTGLGLGLAIDYSLLMVSRFRDALADTGDTERALQITLATAGKTIIYSAITVACSLAGLMAFNTFFLKSFGYAGIAVTALAGAAAVITLPAVLAILGPKVNALSIPFLRRRREAREASASHASRGWTSWANRMMRRPVLFAGVVLAVLALLAAPALSIQFSLADDRALPSEAPASQVSQALRANFSTNGQDDVKVVAYGTEGSAPDRVADYASRLSSVPGVDRVDALTGSYVAGHQVAPANALSQRFAARTGDGSYLTAQTHIDPLSAQSRDLVKAVRDLPAPFPVQVTGQGATLADTLAGQAQGLPWALGIMALATIVLLALMTGSIVVPIKAIAMNVLTLSATFGIMVWVFQEGHLKWLVGDFQETGYVVSNMPLLLLCIAFGLSMDYEMFLLSRIKEEYDRTGDNRRAVVAGISRTGRIITAAAILLAVVFLSFVTSGILYLKLMGLGTGLAILIDATLIRGVLLPSVMALMGDVNWWGPRFLKRWSASFSHGESAQESAPESAQEALAAPAVGAEALPAEHATASSGRA
ncbi:MMPL family transporter [Sinomonas sp. JGH33]|uniref:MMPL family transporter n=1 Tax=Sinomonas terricola TaxID=3110330 RepID=A0ABU5T699_9MICC|nr:MMPL family transporter [Sinomonas sp. JGH33]MEA5455184.1 MMPL family transporter [Sinomonas sp. JGH33]